jgi:hypothetical protein
MTDENEDNTRLEVYKDRSVLFSSGLRQEFLEGDPSVEAQERHRKIRNALEAGFFKDCVAAGKVFDLQKSKLPDDIRIVLSKLVDSVSSEMGRAIVGLAVLQLTVKAISPTQSIRLHKAGGRGGNFSWVDGLPMRVLDASFITPTLRKSGLLHLDADGVFMTRSLAENYPYSKVYKAAIRGAKAEWLEVVDLLEVGELNALDALNYLLSLLARRSSELSKREASTLKAITKIVPQITSLDLAAQFVLDYVHASRHSARVFEIALHSFFQVLEDLGAFDGFLKPLSQMRSANKKHGNVGDIEIVQRVDGLQILEAWDAKYGAAYLRDELEELHEKLNDHEETGVAGFVTDKTPNSKQEIQERIEDLEQLHATQISIVGFLEWVKTQSNRVKTTERKLAKMWMIAFAETICQRRRDRAPIDEPTQDWVKELATHAKDWKSS